MDGRVEGIAEGDREDIEGFLRRLKEGPPLAHVDDVDIRWEEYKGEFKDFRVTYSNF